jgi:hypothetical protein
MNCRTLVHEIDRDQPKTMKELLNIATRHASSEEAVMAIFIQSCRKAALVDDRGAPPKTTDKSVKRGTKSDKRELKQQPHQVAVTTNCDEGDNSKDVGDSDEELIVIAKRDFKRQVWQPTDHFGKLLEATCPNNTYPIMHKLKKCTMMKNYMTTRTFAKGKSPEGDPTGKAATPFPEEKTVMSIYGGPAPMSPGVSSNLPAKQSTL